MSSIVPLEIDTPTRLPDRSCFCCNRTTAQVALVALTVLSVIGTVIALSTEHYPWTFVGLISSGICGVSAYYIGQPKAPRYSIPPLFKNIPRLTKVAPFEKGRANLYLGRIRNKTLIIKQPHEPLVHTTVRAAGASLVQGWDHPHLVTPTSFVVERGGEMLHTETLQHRDSIRLEIMPLHLIRSGAEQSFSLTHLKWIARQLVETVQDLHQRNILHAGIKPGNLLIDREEETIKLLDWDTARLTTHTRLFGHSADSTSPQPPEFINVGHYTPEGEIYALGKTLELLATPPQYRNSPLYTSNWPTSPTFQDLIAQMTHPTPDERPSPTALLTHPFLAE